MSLEHLPPARGQLVKRLRGIWILGLVFLFLGCSYLIWWAWLVMSDRIGTYTNTAAPADLDGDGDLDVVLHNVRQEAEFTAFSQTTLWINQGEGKFTTSAIEFPPYLYLSAAPGDFDGDGDADLLVLAAHRLMLFLNQGGEAGGFRLNQTMMPPIEIAQYGSISLGDLNADGELDGFVAGCCGKAYPQGSDSDPDASPPSISWVWINEWDPRGWLVRHTLSINELDGLAMPSAALGDLDGDGDLDVFAAVQQSKPGQDDSPADRVLLNDGQGSFTDSGQRLGQTNSSSVALGDLDNDGDLDALVGTEHGGRVWFNLGKVQNGAAGAYAASEQEIGGGRIRAVFLADLDNDSDLDALAAADKQAVVWWNDGRGVFTQSDQRFRYSDRHALAVGDFNGDGSTDIFAAAYAEAYRLWINQGGGVFR